MHLIWNDYLYIEASEIYLLLCVFIENCAVLTNYLLLLLDTPDRFFSYPFHLYQDQQFTFMAVRESEQKHEKKPDW